MVFFFQTNQNVSPIYTEESPTVTHSVVVVRFHQTSLLLPHALEQSHTRVEIWMEEKDHIFLLKDLSREGPKKNGRFEEFHASSAAWFFIGILNFHGFVVIIQAHN